MPNILGYNTERIKKSMLSQRKRDMVLGLIFFVFLLIPLEAHRVHRSTVTKIWVNSNIKIWFKIRMKYLTGRSGFSREFVVR
jgi:hypothetical protein